MIPKAYVYRCGLVPKFGPDKTSLDKCDFTLATCYETRQTLCKLYSINCFDRYAVAAQQSVHASTKTTTHDGQYIAGIYVAVQVINRMREGLLT